MLEDTASYDVSVSCLQGRHRDTAWPCSGYALFGNVFGPCRCACHAPKAIVEDKGDFTTEKLAFELFQEVHGKLGHGNVKDFNAIPQRKDAWIEIARAFENRAARFLDSLKPFAPPLDIKIVDRAARFLGGLNLQDHSREEQREALEIVRELAVALKKTR